MKKENGNLYGYVLKRKVGDLTAYKAKQIDELAYKLNEAKVFDDEQEAERFIDDKRFEVKKVSVQRNSELDKAFIELARLESELAGFYSVQNAISTLKQELEYHLEKYPFMAVEEATK